MNIDVKTLKKILANWTQQYIKKIIQMSRWVVQGDAKLVQYLQINTCDTSHKQNEGWKSNDHIHTHRKKHLIKSSTHL